MSTKFHLTGSAYLLGTVLIAILLGDLGRIQIVPSIYISVLDVSVAVFVLHTLRLRRVLSDSLQRNYVGWIGLLFFTMIFTLSLRLFALPFKDILIASLYPLRWLLFGLLPVAVLEFKNRNESFPIEKWYRKTFVGLALLGFLQLLFFPNLGILQQFGFDPHYLRLVSTWLDPNFIGPAFILGMLFIDSTELNPIRRSALIAALFLALLATFSRSSYLAFAVSGLAYVILRRSWQKTLLVLAGICILYFSFSIPRQNLEKSRNIDRNVSAGSRLISYSQGLQIFEGNPIFGIGFNSIRAEKKRLGIIDESGGGNSGAGIDSSWILILATMGIVGLLLYVSYWIRLVYFIVEPKVTKHHKIFHSLAYSLLHASALEHALLAFLVGLSVHSWFVNSLLFTLLSALWGIALGIVLASKKD